MGLVSTARAVCAKPRTEKWPCRAHSTDTVTSVHKISALNTSTSATDGTAASPSATLASGKPSITLLENTPPSANTDWPTPSSSNSFHATSRPMANTIKHPPKNASSKRASTGGNLEKSLTSRNSIAGNATVKTKRVRLSDIDFGQPDKRIKP